MKKKKKIKSLNILYNNYDYRKNYLSIYITSTEPTVCCPKATLKK